MWWLVGLALVSIGGVAFFGAPWVPTKAQATKDLLNQVDFKGGRLVDLGSGDGRIMLAAAKRGIKSSGWELSPLVWLVSWWRLRRYRHLADNHLGNFWQADLPGDTTVVFTFLADKYMDRLDKYMQAQATGLNKPLTLVSFGFKITDKVLEAQAGALMIYKFRP